MVRDARKSALLEGLKPHPESLTQNAAYEMRLSNEVVMPGLVPGIHVLAGLEQERRGWPGRARP
jgi:hypothetical protein